MDLGPRWNGPWRHKSIKYFADRLIGAITSRLDRIIRVRDHRSLFVFLRCICKITNQYFLVNLFQIISSNKQITGLILRRGFLFHHQIDTVEVGNVGKNSVARLARYQWQGWQDISGKLGKISVARVVRFQFTLAKILSSGLLLNIIGLQDLAKTLKILPHRKP